MEFDIIIDDGSENKKSFTCNSLDELAFSDLRENIIKLGLCNKFNIFSFFEDGKPRNPNQHVSSDAKVVEIKVRKSTFNSNLPLKRIIGAPGQIKMVIKKDDYDLTLQELIDKGFEAEYLNEQDTKIMDFYVSPQISITTEEEEEEQAREESLQKISYAPVEVEPFIPEENPDNTTTTQQVAFSNFENSESRASTVVEEQVEETKNEDKENKCDSFIEIWNEDNNTCMMYPFKKHKTLNTMENNIRQTFSFNKEDKLRYRNSSGDIIDVNQELRPCKLFVSKIRGKEQSRSSNNRPVNPFFYKKDIRKQNMVVDGLTKEEEEIEYRKIEDSVDDIIQISRILLKGSWDRNQVQQYIDFFGAENVDYVATLMSSDIKEHKKRT